MNHKFKKGAKVIALIDDKSSETEGPFGKYGFYYFVKYKNFSKYGMICSLSDNKKNMTGMYWAYPHNTTLL